MKKITFLSTLITSLFFTTHSQAKDFADSFYLGASVGFSEMPLTDSADTPTEFGEFTSTFGEFSYEESDSSFKLFGGYQFTEHFAIEVSYSNYGSYGIHSDLNGNLEFDEVVVDIQGAMKSNIDLTSTGVALVGQFEIVDNITAYAKYGQSQWDAELNMNLDLTLRVVADNLSETISENPSESTSSENSFYALGLHYSFDDYVVYLEHESLGLEGVDLTSFNLGIRYHFL